MKEIHPLSPNSEILFAIDTDGDPADAALWRELYDSSSSRVELQAGNLVIDDLIPFGRSVRSCEGGVRLFQPFSLEEFRKIVVKVKIAGDPTCCPYCGWGAVRFVKRIIAKVSVEGTLMDLAEYECHEECKARRFWV